VHSLCNTLIENYTEILFHMIDEGDIPSIQYKMSFREPKSMGKVDDLSLIFISFYVPALNSTETSLQLSEGTTSFAVQHKLYLRIHFVPHRKHAMSS
jgi:hypothetical protein